MIGRLIGSGKDISLMNLNFSWESCDGMPPLALRLT